MPSQRGINWIDTAAVYGLGHSEEVVRRALEDIPAADRPFIFTKCGQVWDEKNRHGVAPSRCFVRSPSGANARRRFAGSGSSGSISTSSIGRTRPAPRSRIPGPRWFG